jgi:phosphoribosylamine--glycine ligase
MAWKCAQSPAVEKVYVAPGNGGSATELRCENVAVSGEERLADFAEAHVVGLTLVGPEAPLAAGIVDRFRSRHLPIVGPDKRAAALEASKAFSKRFMSKYGVRTAASRDFSDFDAALQYARKHFEGGNAALVVKADGLAAGKGVVVAGSEADAEAALRSFLLEGSLGAAGKTVVLEQCLVGSEVSILAAVSVRNGEGSIVPFVPARDHKRRFDKGRGPNTGGMGAIAPVSDFSEAARADFTASILEPTLLGLKQEGFDYRGFIFFGLMVEESRSYLLEYNVRLGDPETQAVLPLLDADFTGLCLAIECGTLADFPLFWRSGAVSAPVAVSSGYPGAYRKGARIDIDRAAVAESGAKLFFAGAQSRDGGLYASGGRVLAASAYGADADAARSRAYQALRAVSFDEMAYREDIGL